MQLEEWWKSLSPLKQAAAQLVVAVALTKPLEWLLGGMLKSLRTRFVRLWRNRSTRSRVKSFRIFRSQYNVYVRWAANPALMESVRDDIRLTMIKGIIWLVVVVYCLMLASISDSLWSSRTVSQSIQVVILSMGWVAVLETFKGARQDSQYLMRAHRLIRKRGKVELRKRRPRKTTEAAIREMAAHAADARAIISKYLPRPDDESGH